MIQLPPSAPVGRSLDQAKLQIGNEMVEVADVEDRWYSPGATYFRVRLTNGDRYVVRREDAQDVWTLEAFRSPR